MGLGARLWLGLWLVDAAATGNQREAKPLVVRLECEGAEDLVRVGGRGAGRGRVRGVVKIVAPYPMAPYPKNVKQ